MQAYTSIYNLSVTRAIHAEWYSIANVSVVKTQKLELTREIDNLELFVA